MDGSAFRNLDLSFLFGWRFLTLIIIGLVSTVGMIGMGLWWLLSHLGVVMEPIHLALPHRR